MTAIIRGQVVSAISGGRTAKLTTGLTMGFSVSALVFFKTDATDSPDQVFTNTSAHIRFYFLVLLCFHFLVFLLCAVS